eukprot:6470641-Prymnesium_polylepis.1
MPHGRGCDRGGRVWVCCTCARACAPVHGATAAARFAEPHGSVTSQVWVPWRMGGAAMLSMMGAGCWSVEVDTRLSRKQVDGAGVCAPRVRAMYCKAVRRLRGGRVACPA